MAIGTTDRIHRKEADRTEEAIAIVQRAVKGEAYRKPIPRIGL